MESTYEIAVLGIMASLLVLILFVPFVIVIIKGKTSRLRVVFGADIAISETVEKMESIGCRVIGVETDYHENEITIRLEIKSKRDRYSTVMTELVAINGVKYLAEEVPADPSDE